MTRNNYIQILRIEINGYALLMGATDICMSAT